jgi:hypothetical protein
VASITMTVEEYLDLIDKAAQGGKQITRGVRKVSRAVKKRTGKKDPKMAKALRKANSLGRKKSGGFKKGYSQARIMKKAHALRRKMR